jgi:hypothetical protein
MLHRFREQAEGATSRFSLQVLAAGFGPLRNSRIRLAFPLIGVRLMQKSSPEHFGPGPKATNPACPLNGR